MAQDAKPSVLIDLTSGTVGGIAGVVVGQPFDTVRLLCVLVSLRLVD
jgi:hypothetical protein